MTTVYNLSVADYHTYFVGSPDWGFSVWAHNMEYEAKLIAGAWRVVKKGTTEPVTSVTFKDAAEAAEWIARNAQKIDPNRLNHIFGKAEHALDSLVTKYGSQEKAFEAVQNAANKALAEGKLTPGKNGVLPVGDSGIIIDVDGVPVRLIGGRVQGRNVQISSFSRKGL